MHRAGVLFPEQPLTPFTEGQILGDQFGNFCTGCLFTDEPGYNRHTTHPCDVISIRKGRFTMKYFPEFTGANFRLHMILRF